MEPILVKRTQILDNKVSRQVQPSEKHGRAKLDETREKCGLSIRRLNEMLPALVGRKVGHYCLLSNGEISYVERWLRTVYAKGR
jgi:hypothetical protein